MQSVLNNKDNKQEQKPLKSDELAPPRGERRSPFTATSALMSDGFTQMLC